MALDAEYDATVKAINATVELEEWTVHGRAYVGARAKMCQLNKVSEAVGCPAWRQL